MWMRPIKKGEISPRFFGLLRRNIVWETVANQLTFNPRLNAELINTYSYSVREDVLYSLCGFQRAIPNIQIHTNKNILLHQEHTQHYFS